MINTKAVKGRIKSVKNTKKITKAMEMIAAVKMRKAVEAAMQTREYSTMANDLLTHLGGTNLDHPLAKERKVKKELIIMITSNRGLCGSYNSKVMRAGKEYLDSRADIGVKDGGDEDMEEKQSGPEAVSVIAIGKKAAQFAKREGLELAEFYEKLNEKPVYEDVLPLAKSIMDDFKEKKFDKVSIIFTNYISGLKQEVITRQILPLSQSMIEEFIKMIAKDDDSKKATKQTKNQSEEVDSNEDNESEIDFEEVQDYEFEPGKTTLLNYLIPMLVEIQIFQALLESSASEHSSRMIAMKNASDAAGDMIDDLTLEYNKGRQAAITQEISEIVAGASAL